MYIGMTWIPILGFQNHLDNAIGRVNWYYENFWGKYTLLDIRYRPHSILIIGTTNYSVIMAMVRIHETLNHVFPWISIT